MVTAAHVHDHAHPHAHAHPREGVEPHNVGAGEGPVLVDVGDGMGALVVHAPRDLVGVEVELAPTDGSAAATHVAVVLRTAEGRELPTAVFPSLVAGRYGLWLRPAADPPVPVLHLDVVDSEVRETTWPSSPDSTADPAPPA